MEDKVRGYIRDLHAAAEELRKSGTKPELQCLLRWSATALASLSISRFKEFKSILRVLWLMCFTLLVIAIILVMN